MYYKIMQDDARELQGALALLGIHFEAERQEKEIPGMSVAVVYNKEIIWTKGFGYANLRDKIPATPQTIYRIGSITKPFTATMLMQLRDAGKLQLDDSIEKYLPAFNKIKSRFYDSKPPTFRQIASHNAGLPREVPINCYQTLKFPSIEDVLESLEDAEMSFPPMTKFKYSNLGYVIIGHALEIAAGKPYREYITQHILQPLGMKRTFFDVRNDDNDKNKMLATGYIPCRENGSSLKIAPIPDIGGLAPAGQLYSSVEDICKFISLQFGEDENDGNGTNPKEEDTSHNRSTKKQHDKQILASTSIREMHSIHSISPDWKRGYGIGWELERIAGHTTVHHGGGIFGFSTGIVAVPDIKLGIAIFTNFDRWPQGLMHYCLELLIPIVSRIISSRRQRPQSQQKKMIMTSPSSAITTAVKKEEELQTKWQRDYAGRYSYKISAFDIEIKIVKKKLIMVDLEEQPSSEEEIVTLVPETEDKFRMLGGPLDGELAIFECDVNGSATALRIGGISLERK